jgi:hypothetical protein
VTKVDGDLIDLEVWGEDPDGQRTTIGSATVEIPSPPRGEG